MRFKLLALICLILIIPSCTAIGVRPAYQVIDFEPNLNQKITFTVHNTEEEAITGVVEVPVESEPYLAVSKRKVSLEPKGYADITFMVSLPAVMEPGRNKLYFSVTEEAADGGGFNAYTAIRSFIEVDVPYPGEYLIASLSAPDVKIGEVVPIEITLKNDGTDTVPAAQGILDIVGNGVVEAKSVAFEEVGSKQTVTSLVEWDTNESVVGKYLARVTVDYEGGSTTAETHFKVGDLLVNILDVAAEEVPQGWRSRVDVFVESKWNEPIEGAYAELEIEGKVFESQTDTIPSWDAHTFTTYVETDEFELGDHAGIATVYYADKTVTSDFTLTIKKPINMYMIIGAVVGVSALIIVSLMFFMKRKYSRT